MAESLTLKKGIQRMISTRLYWVAGPWPGKLALAARPRGGEWLEDEIRGWRDNGVDIVLSLLTDEEERELDIARERFELEAQGVEFISFPIPDRQVPASGGGLTLVLSRLDSELTAGRNVLVHCRQGIGRTGLVAACLLLTKGFNPETAITQLSEVRGMALPETPEQRQWINHYAGYSTNVENADVLIREMIEGKKS